MPPVRRIRKGYTGHGAGHHHRDAGYTSRRHEEHRLRKHFGGWRPSPPDPRRAIADTFGIHLRSEVDPRPEMPPIFDQGRLGACTANATAAAFEYDALLDGNLTGPLSRLWIYYNERKLEGVLGEGDIGVDPTLCGDWTTIRRPIYRR